MTDLLLPHQQRVVVEKLELDTKIAALHTFMRTIVVQDLPFNERDRLKRQFALMGGYSEVLGERIVNFG